MARGMERSNPALVTAFADALREERLRLGLTQEELADRADVSARFISFLETGRRQPSLSALASVAKGLGLSLSALTAKVEKRFMQGIL